MAEDFTVAVCAPDADGLVAGALAGRAAGDRTEAMVFESERLAAFFEPDVQQRLPRVYDLVLCGPEVCHSDWDGRLVRPRLMDALRAFVGRIRWYSRHQWEPEDLRAVGHLAGEENLVVREGARSVAMLVAEERFGPDDEYEQSLARFAAGDLQEREREAWGDQLAGVLTALKASPSAMADAIGMLMEGKVQELIRRHGDLAERTEEDNRCFARTQADEPLRMGEAKLVFLSLPAARHPFWAEISQYARQETGADASLCHLEGRPAMVLSAAPDTRFDLRAWARYVTDLLPGAQSVKPGPHVVPLVVRGLEGDPGLKDEVLRLLEGGAHLLRG